MDDFVSLTQLVSNVAEAFTTTVFLPEKSRKNLYLKSYYSLGDSIIEDAIIPIGQGLVGLAAENNQPINLAPFKQDSRTLQFYSTQEDIQSFLAIPFAAGELNGVLCVDSKKHYSFTPYQQKILTGFAEQFSRLVAREEEIKQNQGNLEVGALYKVCQKIYSEKRKINILDTLSRPPLDLIPYDGCSVTILSDNNKKSFILRSSGYDDCNLSYLKIEQNNSLVGFVLKNNKILNYPDLKRERRKTFVFQSGEPDFSAKSFLGLPIRSGDQVIGAWSFTGKDSSQFQPRHVKIASLISLMAAAALAKPKISPEESTYV